MEGVVFLRTEMFKPVGKKVLVELSNYKTEFAKGHFLDLPEGEMVPVGYIRAAASSIEKDFPVGERVLFLPTYGPPLEVDGVKMILMKHSDILTVGGESI